MNFVAIDLETANADQSSVCQIGLASYHDGRLADEWQSLVDPEDYFDPINISIHGISDESVKGSPIFPEVIAMVAQRIAGNVVVCHTPFDRIALSRACERYDIPPLECSWLDSARVARRAWKQFARSGYGLRNICAEIGHSFRHHDALEDAKAAAAVLLAASEKTGLNMDGWFSRIMQPIFPAESVETNPEGPLFGEVLVFTGELQRTRSEAAAIAANAGCQVSDTVTKQTTILVVGDQDARKLAGHEKSSKHRKAERLIREGQAIRLFTESDFEKLIRVQAEYGQRDEHRGATASGDSSVMSLR